MKKVKLTDNMLQQTNSTAVENDMSYIVSVLHEIDKVISNTYGPEAGYVAQHDVKDTNAFSYSKDGLTTLSNLKFTEETDNIVLNMVQMLAMEIKSNSGDGSTTATKLLYHMCRNALEEMYNSKTKLHNIRITTPKAMEQLIKLITKEIKDIAIKTPDYQSLRDAAFIALNNDESLMQPFDDLIAYMKQNEAKIDKTLRIEAFKSYRNETTIDTNPGYVLGTKGFSVDSTLGEVTDAKVVLMPNNISSDMLHFVISRIMRDIQIFGSNKKIKVIFVVNSIDDMIKDFLKSLLKKAQSENDNLMCDFIELSLTTTENIHRSEDLSYLLNTNPINLYDYIEKRDPVEGSEIDTPNTTNLTKFKATYKNGIIDEYGYTQFLDELYKSLTNSFYCNVKISESVGLTLSLAEIAKEKQYNEAYKTLLDNHIKGLEIQSKSDDSEIAREAATRLFYLSQNFYIINIARRIGDNERIYTAYKDAAKALTSIARHGYYTGGSASLYEVTQKVRTITKKMYKEDIHNVLNKTLDFLAMILTKSVFDVIRDLKPSYKDYIVGKTLFIDHIDVDKHLIDNVPVIVPVETDLVMVPNTLYLFSSVFSSLLIEFTNGTDAGRVRYIAQKVENAVHADIDTKVEDKPKSKVESSVPCRSSADYTNLKYFNDIDRPTKVKEQPKEEKLIIPDVEESNENIFSPEETTIEDEKVTEPVVEETKVEEPVEETKEEPKQEEHKITYTYIKPKPSTPDEEIDDLKARLERMELAALGVTREESDKAQAMADILAFQSPIPNDDKTVVTQLDENGEPIKDDDGVIRVEENEMPEYVKNLLKSE